MLLTFLNQQCCGIFFHVFSLVKTTSNNEILYTQKTLSHKFCHEKCIPTQINFWGFLEYIMCRHENVVQVFQVSILFQLYQVSVSLIFYTVLLVRMFANSRNSFYHKICDLIDF